jgi:hypothetical protein
VDEFSKCKGIENEVGKLVEHQHEIICKNVVVNPFARFGL